MFNLTPEHRRLDVMPWYFKHPILFMTFESMVYRFAKELLPAYDGGYWEFYESLETFYMAPGHDSDDIEFEVVSPNGHESVLTRREAGMVITLFAMSNLTMFAYEKNIDSGFIVKLYQSLRSEFENCEHAQEMFALID